MVDTEPDSDFSKNDRHLLLRSGQHTYRVSLEKALALAHSLMKAKQYKTALQICQRVASLDVRDPQPAILLACCEAGLKDYEACQKTLHAVYSGDKEALAAHLQAAFVYHNLGMNVDSARELLALTDEQPNLPVAWLMLGDRLDEMGKREKATLCWQLTIDRDRLNGAATMAAKHELACAKRTQRSKIKP